jgi:Uma2 family endonuclease
MSDNARRRATPDDFWAIPEDVRFHELIDGEIIPKATPAGEHGETQASIVGSIVPSYRRPAGRGGPGGWWIVTEVEVLLGDAIVRPDVTGWRRERCPERPTGMPIKLRPDWVCEIISDSNAKNDTIKKLRLYHRAQIPYYWLADPRDATLTVMRWSEAGYTTLQKAERGETIRAEPFEAVEIIVGTLFGDDPPAQP